MTLLANTEFQDTWKGGGEMQEQVIGLDLMLGLPDEFKAHLTSLMDILKYSSRRMPLCASRSRQENVSSLPSSKYERRNIL